jgi:hypothetical protein
VRINNGFADLKCHVMPFARGSILPAILRSQNPVKVASFTAYLM